MASVLLHPRLLVPLARFCPRAGSPRAVALECQISQKGLAAAGDTRYEIQLLAVDATAGYQKVKKEKKESPCKRAR